MLIFAARDLLQESYTERDSNYGNENRLCKKPIYPVGRGSSKAPR